MDAIQAAGLRISAAWPALNLVACGQLEPWLHSGAPRANGGYNHGMSDSRDQKFGQLTARALLQLAPTGADSFRSSNNQDNQMSAIFGGQFLAQALAAAQKTVGDWPAHNCTGYFHRRGLLEHPVDYAVERVRDGQRFAARRVLARQADRPLFDMLCSFHDPDTGFEHQFADPGNVPAPDSLPSEKEFLQANASRLPAEVVEMFSRPFPMEVRLLDAEQFYFGKRNRTEFGFWFRLPSADVVEDPRDHQCLLAFMSDLRLATAASMLHASPMQAGNLAIASLAHSLWFHEVTRADQWLLYRMESPWAGKGRGLVRGLIYDRHGRLVATAMQEVVMRAVKAEPTR